MRPALAISLVLAGCDLGLDGFTFHCATAADCPPNDVCGVGGVCQASVATGSTTASSGGSGTGTASTGGSATSTAGSATSAGGTTAGATSTGGSTTGSTPSTTGSAIAGHTSSGLAPGLTMALVAGTGQEGQADGTLTQAEFAAPQALAVVGNLVYVASWQDSTIQVIDVQAGQVATLVDGGSPATWPESLLAVGSQLYFGDTWNDQIDVAALAGGAVTPMFNTQALGSSDTFNGLAAGSAGTIYVSDEGDGCVGTLNAQSGALVPFAGTCQGQGSYTDGLASMARFDMPEGIAVDPSGNVYVAENNKNTIRKIAGGMVSTFSGNPNSTAFPIVDVDGPIDQAQFYGPYGLVADSKGDLFLTETSGNSVREIVLLPDAGYFVKTLATYAYQGADPLTEPYGIALDEDGGNLYVCGANQVYVLRGF